MTDQQTDADHHAKMQAIVDRVWAERMPEIKAAAESAMWNAMIHGWGAIKVADDGKITVVERMD